ERHHSSTVCDFCFQTSLSASGGSECDKASCTRDLPPAKIRFIQLSSGTFPTFALGIPICGKGKGTLCNALSTYGKSISQAERCTYSNLYGRSCLNNHYSGFLYLLFVFINFSFHRFWVPTVDTRLLVHNMVRKLF